MKIYKLNEDIDDEDEVVGYNWRIFGEYGDLFKRLSDAKKYAKELSLQCPDEKISIFNISDGMYYIDYLNGKCVRDEWTLPIRDDYVNKFVASVREFENNHGFCLHDKALKDNAKNWKLTVKERNLAMKLITKDRGF